MVPPVSGTEGAVAASGAPVGRVEDDDYRPALDGLRAVAVIAVVLFHLDRLPGGNLGVDAFFVLSGWLITTRLLAQADRSITGRIDLGTFWAARARRLFPASLAVILVVIVAWSAAGITVTSLRHDALWALGFASNWGTVVAGGDYWARFGEPSPLTHLWSLAVEEQIYLLWPLVLYVVIRRGRPQRGLLVTATSLALAGASIAWMVTSYDPLAPTSTYVDTFARAHSLLIGAAAAGVTSTVRGRRLAARLGRYAMRPAVYLLVGIVTVASADADWLYAWGFPLFAVAMAVVVVAAAEGVGAPVLASRPLRWLGQRSYGVYLWHWPAILFLSGPRTPLSGAALDVLRVVVAVAIATASYRWLELPIRRRQVLTTRWAPAVALGSLAAAAAVVLSLEPPRASTPTEASTVALQPPPPAGPPPTVQGAVWTGPTLSSLPTDLGSVVLVSLRAGVEPPAPTPAHVGPVRVLVAGDSTAVQLAEELIGQADSHPDQLVVGSAAFPGCGLSAGTDGRLHEHAANDGSPQLVDLKGCTTQWTTIVGRVAAEQVDVVLMSIGAWDGADIHLTDGRVVSVADPVGRQLVIDSYHRFILDVEGAGADVVWVTPPDLHLRWGEVDMAINDPRRWAALRAVIEWLPVDEIDLPGWLAAEGLSGPDGRPDGVHLAGPVSLRFAEEVVVPTLLARDP